MVHNQYRFATLSFRFNWTPARRIRQEIQSHRNVRVIPDTNLFSSVRTAGSLKAESAIALGSRPTGLKNRDNRHNR